MLIKFHWALLMKGENIWCYMTDNFRAFIYLSFLLKMAFTFKRDIFQDLSAQASLHLNECHTQPNPQSPLPFIDLFFKSYSSREKCLYFIFHNLLGLLEENIGVSSKTYTSFVLMKVPEGAHWGYLGLLSGETYRIKFLSLVFS